MIQQPKPPHLRRLDASLKAAVEGAVQWPGLTLTALVDRIAHRTHYRDRRSARAAIAYHIRAGQLKGLLLLDIPEGRVRGGTVHPTRRAVRQVRGAAGCGQVRG